MQHAERKQSELDLHPPLDIVDGVARVVDPVVESERTGKYVWGRCSRTAPRRTREVCVSNTSRSEVFEGSEGAEAERHHPAALRCGVRRRARGSGGGKPPLACSAAGSKRGGARSVSP